MENKIKLTEFSHGYGCGCKISPAVLSSILSGAKSKLQFPNMIVGNATNDDAAVMDLGNGQALVSTTDFFMPIVDDAFNFGKIAATNAISDVFAMGGKPIMALAILGWPIDKLPAELASEVMRGAVEVCDAAGIPLAGGHTIDSPEPIFGLAVNGLVQRDKILTNQGIQKGDFLFITKPLGVGVIATAHKMGKASDEDLNNAIESMCRLNSIGALLPAIKGVHALTDVTGFGLFGHLLEMLEGTGFAALIDTSSWPVLPNINKYLAQYTIPAITYRNWNSYGMRVEEPNADVLHLGCDPQTSGGLLIAVAPEAVDELVALLKENNIPESCLAPIGRVISKEGEWEVVF
ncbi:MAG: selenide, water dikinase SelD [Bacteroidota bacterium]|jgi:selenide,water dikinase